MKIKRKLVDSKGNKLPADTQIKNLSPSLQQFLRLLVDKMLAEDMKVLEAKNRTSKAQKKSRRQAKGTTSDHPKKKKPLKIKGFCDASPRGFEPRFLP